MPLGGGPVGVELSGGLDSSAVAVLAARELRRRGLAPPPAFTGYPPPPEPMPPEWEGGYGRVRSVATQEGLRLFYHTWTPGDFLRNLSQDLCLPGAADSYPVSLAAGEGVRVLLSGLGGDECVSNTGAGRDFGLLPGGVCWSEDKSDPAVHAAFVKAFALEMPSLRRAVLAPEAPLTRTGYVDVPRLLERLGDVEGFRRRPRPLPILNALALLDFQPPLPHGKKPVGEKKLTRRTKSDIRGL